MQRGGAGGALSPPIGAHAPSCHCGARRHRPWHRPPPGRRRSGRFQTHANKGAATAAHWPAAGVSEVSAESQKNRAGPTAACSASGAGRCRPASPETKVSPRQPPLGQRAAIASTGAGGVRQPGPRGRRLCLTLGGGAFKGPAVGRTWGPLPQSILRGRGETVAPSVDPSFLPAWWILSF